MSNAKPYSTELHKVRYKVKGIMLFIVPFPIFIAALLDLINGNIIETLVNALAFTGFMIAALVARKGFYAEGEYHRRTITKAPSVPFKTVAALFLSISVGFTAWLSIDSFGLIQSLAFAITSFIGFALYYGLDPRKDKTESLAFGITAEEVIETLEAAELKIADIDQARRKIHDLQLNEKLRNIVSKARKVLQNIEQNPETLDRSRRFLTVYLDGAKRVTESYAKTQTGSATIANHSMAYETDFSNVLDAIEETIAQQEQKLLKDDQFDLDVQIQVLETQLLQEGITTNKTKP